MHCRCPLKTVDFKVRVDGNYVHVIDVVDQCAVIALPGLLRILFSFWGALAFRPLLFTFPDP